jgi:hypothetical protein
VSGTGSAILKNSGCLFGKTRGNSPASSISTVFLSRISSLLAVLSFPCLSSTLFVSGTLVFQIGVNVHAHGMKESYDATDFLYEPPFEIDPRIRSNEAFLSIWNASDLPHIMNRFAEVAMHHYLHLAKNLKKTEAKIRM